MLVAAGLVAMRRSVRFLVALRVPGWVRFLAAGARRMTGVGARLVRYGVRGAGRSGGDDALAMKFSGAAGRGDVWAAVIHGRQQIGRAHV